MVKILSMLLVAALLTVGAPGLCEPAPASATESALESAPNAASAASYVPPQPGDPVTVESDFGLMVDGAWYPMMTDVQTVLAALGEPLEVIERERDTPTDGRDKEYIYEFGSIYSYPENGVDVWFETFIDGFDYPTVRGVKIGDTRADVTAAYGDGYFEDGSNVLTYNMSGVEGDYNSPCVIIEVIKGGVIYVDIFYPVYEWDPEEEM